MRPGLMVYLTMIQYQSISLSYGKMSKQLQNEKCPSRCVNEECPEMQVHRSRESVQWKLEPSRSLISYMQFIHTLSPTLGHDGESGPVISRISHY